MGRFSCLFFIFFFLYSCHLHKRPNSLDYMPVCHGYHLDNYNHLYNFGLKNTGIEYWDYEKRLDNEECKVKILHLKDFDSVSVYQKDTLISVFLSRQNKILDSIRVFYPSGILRLNEHLSDSIPNTQDINIEYYFQKFSGLPKGLTESFYSNGNRKRLANIVHNSKYPKDSLEKLWHPNGVMSYYRHKDSTFKWDESGKKESEQYFKRIGKHLIYSVTQFWPNGKRKSEEFYTDEGQNNPCYAWLEYNENGKVIKRTTKSTQVPLSPATEYHAVRLERSSLNFQLSLERLSKSFKIDFDTSLRKEFFNTPGKFTYQFAINHADGTIQDMVLHTPASFSESYALKEVLTKCLYNQRMLLDQIDPITFKYLNRNGLLRIEIEFSLE